MMSVAPLSIVPPLVPARGSYILLVDDHEPSLKRLDELVTLSGHRCISAHSGTDAVRLCDIRRPRVVVTDLAMPNLDGRGLARWLQMRYPSVPFILMTGQEFDAQTLAELRRTFTAVLSKPVDIDQLLSLLERLTPTASNREGDHDHSAGLP
jgi:CheY-like chemotaxis protein